jgi:hypothetical protein
MEEGVGSTTADIIGGNTGALQNNTSWTTGKYGKALSFSGGSGTCSSCTYVSIPSAPPLNFGVNQDFTLSAWVKSTQSIGSNVYPGIIGKDDNNGGARQGYEMILHNANSDAGWYFEIVVGGTFYSDFGRSNIADGKWHHVGIRSGSTLLTYEDGTLANSLAASSGSVSSTVPLLLGVYTQSGNLVGVTPFLNGTIDDVYIYNRALSAAEVKQLYKDQAVNIAHSNTTALSSGLIGHWPLNGPATHWNLGTTADTSGQGNTGTR